MSNYYLIQMYMDNLDAGEEFSQPLKEAGIEPNPKNVHLNLFSWFPSWEVETFRNVKYYDEHRKVTPFPFSFSFFLFAPCSLLLAPCFF